MSDAGGTLNLDVKFNLRDEQARAQFRSFIAETQKLASGAAGGPTPAQFAETISRLRQTQEAGISRATGYKAGYAPVGTGAKAEINALNKAIRDAIRATPADFQRELKNLGVVTPAGQRRFVREDVARERAQATRDRTLGLPPGTAREVDKWGKDVRAATNRLIGGRESQQFMQDILRNDTETKRFAARAQQGRNADAEYQKAALDAARARAEGAAKAKAAAAADEQLARATGQAAQSRVLLDAKGRVLSRGGTVAGKSDEQIRDEAARITQAERTSDRARRDAAAAQDQGALQRAAAANRSTLAFNLAQRKATVATEGYAEDTASLRQTNRDFNNRVRALGGGYSAADIDRLGTEAAAGATAIKQASERRTSAWNSLTRQELDQLAKNQVSYAEQNAALKFRTKEILNQAIKEGQLGGTFTQRTLARLSPGVRTPADFATGGGLIGSRFLTTATFGASAFATGAIIGGITETIRDATTLEKTFVKMRGQLGAIGRSDEFGSVRSDIKRIAAETGAAATDVAEFSSRLFGVFPKESTAEIMQETADAMKLMAVSGLDMSTIMQSVIPISKSFGVSLAEIGSIAVDTGELLGLPEDQVISFLGKAGIVANETGLELRELTAIGSTMGQNLGKDLSASADVFNKMPALIRRNQREIVGVMERSGVEETAVSQFRAAISAGQEGEALITLLRNIESGAISPEAAQQLPGLIGNPREIEEVTAVIENAGLAIRRINDPNFLPEGGTASLEGRFTDLQATVSHAFQRMERALESFGESLLRTGIADVFTEIASSAELAFGAVGALTEIITLLNNITKVGPFEDGLISPLARVATQAFIVTKVLGLLNKARLAGIAKLTQTTAGVSAEATARTTNAGAANAEAAAVGRSNATKTFSHVPGGVVVSGGAGAAAQSAAASSAATAAASTAAARAASEQVARQSLAYRIGQYGSLPGQASFLSRALSGGGGRFTGRIPGIAGITAGANAATTGAGLGTGIAGAGLLLPAAGITIAAVGTVKSQYDKQAAGVEGAANELREKLKEASREDLENIARARTGIFDQFTLRLFGEDLPEEMARAEGLAQDTSDAADRAEAIFEESAGPVIERFLQSAAGEDDLSKIVEGLNNYRGRERQALFKAAGFLRVRTGDAELTAEDVRTERIYEDVTIDPTAGEVVRLLDAARKMRESSDADQKALGSQLLQLFDDRILANAEIEENREIFERAGLSKEQAERIAKYGSAVQAASADLEELQTLQAQGRVSSGQFYTKLNELYEKEKAQQDLLTDETDEETRKDVIDSVEKLRKERDQAFNDRITNEIEATSRLIELSGSDTTEQQIAQLTVAALPRFTADERIEKLPEVYDALQKAFESELASISDPVARLQRAREGFEIPETVQAVAIASQIEQRQDIGEALHRFADVRGVTVAEIAQSLGEVAASGEFSVAEAALELQDRELEAQVERANNAMGEFLLRGRYKAKAPERARTFLDLSGEAVQQLFGGASGFFATDIIGFTTLAIDKAKEWDVSIAEAFKRLIEERKAAALALDPEADVSFLDELLSSADSILSTGTVETPERIFQKNRDKLRGQLTDIADKQKADIDVATAGIREDPLAEAQARLEQAWIDYGVELELQSQGLDDPAARQRAYAAVLDQLAAVEEAQQDIVIARLKWAEILAAGDPVGENQAKITVAQQQLADVLAATGGNENSVAVISARQELAKLAQEAEQNAIDIERSRLEVAAARAAGDPLQEAIIAQQQAALDLQNAKGEKDRNEKFAAKIRADQAVEEAVRAVTLSQFSIVDAYSTRRPLQAAITAQQRAAFELANARGLADQNEKLAAKIRADQSLEDAISAVFESRSNLAQAVAAAAGDPVESARLAALEAQRQLALAVSQGSDETVTNPLRATVVTANEAFARAGRDREQQLIDFQLQMGQITTQAAIASLRALLARTREGTEEYQSLALKIRSLEQQAGQDLQFNLPSTLGLPTLYEARRLEQGTRAAIGYQDNRTVALTVNVNGAGDPSAVAQQVALAFQAGIGAAPTQATAVGVGGF